MAQLESCRYRRQQRRGFTPEERLHAKGPVDVFIIGGGPAGLATAIAARRCGLSVAVADGATPPIDKPCGEGLMPDGISALHDLGIAIPSSACHPFRGIRFLSEGQRAEADFSRAPGLGIRRTALHRILIDHATACGVSLLWGTPVAGIEAGGVRLSNGLARARWIVGADGSNSRVRRWAKLDDHRRKAIRFGFRRHYRVATPANFMELYWANDGAGNDCQIYLTPAAPDEICIALVSSDPHLRLDAALASFPELAARLAQGEVTSTERGAITVSRSLPRVCRSNVALVGDASGGVDAITGEGLCLAFRQAGLLADCLVANNLARYQAEHRRLLRRPAIMARLMLLMGRHPRLRRRTMQIFESRPRSFTRLLAMHVGDGTARDYVANSISLGWQLLTA
jgi:flavin-dependent dehydrogenase